MHPHRKTKSHHLLHKTLIPANLLFIPLHYHLHHYACNFFFFFISLPWDLWITMILLFFIVIYFYFLFSLCIFPPRWNTKLSLHSTAVKTYTNCSVWRQAVCGPSVSPMHQLKGWWRQKLDFCRFPVEGCGYHLYVNGKTRQGRG